MTGKLTKTETIKLAISILTPLAVGAVSGYATIINIPVWYSHLIKPWYNPPNSIFGPVWTTLYIFMGIALFLVWRKPDSTQRNRAILFFFLQLFLNFCWSFIFFYFHMIRLAMIEVAILWFFILITIFLFSTHSKAASWLIVPYISWVSFAVILNIAIYKLNI